MSKPPLLAAIAAFLCAAPPVGAQQADFPDGPGKQAFVNFCGSCHDINRSRAGYTPEGWRTVMRMMLNFDVPVPEDEVETLTQYLIKNFPERPRPAAVVVPGPVEATIKLWQVPTPGSRPHDPLATRDGAIWYTGQLSGKLGRVDPKTGEIKEYPLKTPQTGPHGLVEDKDGNIWFTGNHLSLIGKLDPRTGSVTEYKMPDPKAKDPHTPAVDDNGIVWFTVQNGNMVGRLDPKSGEIKLVTSPTPNSRPYGLLINSKGIPVSSNSAPTRSRPSIRTRWRSRNTLCRMRHHGRAGSRSRPTMRSGMPISRAAISAGLISQPVSTRNGPLPAGRNRNPTGSSLPRARSGTTSPAPSRTRSCASIRRRKNSRAGRSPGAATSCAT
jgi:hypothetical protein